MFEKFKARVQVKAKERLLDSLETRVSILISTSRLLAIHLKNMSPENRAERTVLLENFLKRSEDIQGRYLEKVRVLPDYQPTTPDRAREDFDKYIALARNRANEAQDFLDRLDSMEVNTYSTPKVSR